MTHPVIIGADESTVPEHLVEHASMSDSDLIQILDKTQEQANAGCGLVYEVFAERFSSMVEHYATRIPENNQLRFYVFARERGYCDQQEADAIRESMDNDPSVCGHGIEWDCCPAGCGDQHDDLNFVESDFEVEFPDWANEPYDESEDACGIEEDEPSAVERPRPLRWWGIFVRIARRLFATTDRKECDA